MPFINDMLAEQNRRPVATPADAASVATAQHPATSGSAMTSRFLFEPEAIMTQLRSRIVGQQQALDCIATTLKLVKADIGEPRRPLHISLLLGPTGVGKTELVRVLAEAIHGNADAFCRIDMNTLAQDHYAAAITGAPPGYVGSKEGTTVLDIDKIQGSFSRPGIVLFDEIEKAGKEVIRSLLNVLDNGQLRLTSGTKTIDFRNSLVFMTSNLGAEAIRRYEHSLIRGWRRVLKPSLRARQRHVKMLLEQSLYRSFDPEFINRIDHLIQFNWLERNVLDQLVDIELHKLNGRLAKHDLEVQLDHSARKLLWEKGYDRRFGARAMARQFRQQVELAVAEFLAQPAPINTDARGKRILLGLARGNRISLQPG